jgi:hypothetical protein
MELFLLDAKITQEPGGGDDFGHNAEESRSRKQESRIKKQGARCRKQEVRIKKQGAKREDSTGPSCFSLPTSYFFIRAS